MSYSLITYTDGKQINIYTLRELDRLLQLGYDLLFKSSISSIDEYEVVNKKGHVIAYACTPDSEKSKQIEFDYEMERKAALEEDRRGHYD